MKKYYFLFIILLFSFSCIWGSSNVVYADLPLTGKLIIIDPGHGGADPGTMSGKTYEKDINLKISLALDSEINKLGGSVILTRKGDYDLASPESYWRKRSDFDNRINLINNSKADLYISIHLNYLSNPNYSGPQVFYNKDNQKLAEIVQKYLNKNLNNKREIKTIPKDTYMYSKLNVKGILIECGFLSNYNEKNLLISPEYQNKIANLIAYSLIDYFY